MSKIEKVICLNCKHELEQKPKNERAFGLKQFICPNCKTKFNYPMSSGRRLLWWLWIILFGALSITTISSGGMPIPGLLIIWAIVGLVKDANITRKLKNMKS